MSVKPLTPARPNKREQKHTRNKKRKARIPKPKESSMHDSIDEMFSGNQSNKHK